jgi:hypothetical protein
MVTEAISACDSFSGVSKRIYAKGSYANNTNVRRDSDVDIVVECHECIYWDYDPSVAPPTTPVSAPYVGDWSPAKWRAEVVRALQAKFGRDQVDDSGSVAVYIPEVSGSRPSIDVVPSFHYRRYTNAAKTVFHEGSCVFPKTGAKIINWPQQQLDNGRHKNDLTGKRYKNFVRALKNAENTLVKAGTLEEVPSYFMECLIFMIDNTTLKSGDLSSGFRASLSELYQGLGDESIHGDWVEPNRLKWLFRGPKKWTPAQGRELVLETWRYLEYS